MHTLEDIAQSTVNTSIRLALIRAAMLEGRLIRGEISFLAYREAIQVIHNELWQVIHQCMEVRK